MYIERIIPLMHKLIKYYPYFDTYYSSTNFSYPQWIDKVMSLAECMGQYSERKFIFELQLSVDGPEYINDVNRGQGVTEKCLKNYQLLLDKISQGLWPKNVILNVILKGTWDLDAIHKLNDKEKLIEFFQFYEKNFYEPLDMLHEPNITHGVSIPNVAVPVPATVEDGRIFAELCKKCRELEKENITEHYFKYYEMITPFNLCHNESNINLSYRTCRGGMCGFGHNVIGLLPDNMLSTCNEGFTEFVKEYKAVMASHLDEKRAHSSVVFSDIIKERHIPMCLSDEEYELHEDKIETYYNNNTTSLLTSRVTLIMALAMAGQVEKKYLDENEALKAAIALAESCAYCIKNNYNDTRSFTMEPVGEFKLLLNGALQYLYAKED